MTSLLQTHDAQLVGVWGDMSHRSSTRTCTQRSFGQSSIYKQYCQGVIAVCGAAFRYQIIRKHPF